MWLLDVVDCGLGTDRNVPKARNGKNKEGWCSTASYVWRLSLIVLWGFATMINSPDTSKATGSEARGEVREKGNVIEIILNHLSARGLAK